MMCPITSRVRGYPFEVLLPPDSPIQGVVLADHMKSQDWASRHARFAGMADPDVLAEVTARLLPLIN